MSASLIFFTILLSDYILPFFTPCLAYRSIAANPSAGALFPLTINCGFVRALNPDPAHQPRCTVRCCPTSSGLFVWLLFYKKLFSPKARGHFQGSSNPCRPVRLQHRSTFRSTRRAPVCAPHHPTPSHPRRRSSSIIDVRRRFAGRDLAPHH